MYKFDEVEMKSRTVSWIKDWFKKNGTDSIAVIGISGGKDSSVVAGLCVEALGKDRVLGVLMPCGSQHDISCSFDLVKHLGIKHIKIDIKDAVNDVLKSLVLPDLRVNDKNVGSLALNSIAKTNTPARIRMTTLYGVAACVNGRVANTCNLSEDWVGYSTKYGDAAGDFSPISNFTVTEVKKIGSALGIPKHLIEKVPEDGLSGKTDEDNLGFTYDVLDRYIRFGECPDEAVLANITKRHNANIHKLVYMESFDPGYIGTLNAPDRGY